MVKEEAKMSVRCRQFVGLFTLMLGIVYTFPMISNSIAGGTDSSDSENKFTDTVCTIRNLDETNITDPNHPLVVESKQAILSSGITEVYFEKHFKFLCAVDDHTSNNRSVRWRYHIGEFVAIVDDGIGSMGQIGSSENIHSIRDGMKGFREIRYVISKKKAEKIMRKCIGDFNAPYVFLGTFPGDYGRVGLYLYGRSKKETRYGRGGVRIDVGWVNLETGECKKAQGGVMPRP